MSEKEWSTATVDFVPASPLVDAYAGLAGMLDVTDVAREADAIREAGDVLWRAMSEAERDEARACLALMEVEPLSTDASPDPEGPDDSSTTMADPRSGSHRPQ